MCTIIIFHECITTDSYHSVAAVFVRLNIQGYEYMYTHIHMNTPHTHTCTDNAPATV